jgi:hypothetical protein
MLPNFRIVRLILFLSIALFISCLRSTKDESLPRIQISYFKGIIERPRRTICGEISGIPPMEYKIDTLIVDKELIEEICKCISHLKVNKDFSSCDVRLDCFIQQKIDTIKLCIGEFDCILKDGVSMERNDSLLYLIRKNSGYYNYYKKDQLKYFEELKHFNPEL